MTWPTKELPPCPVIGNPSTWSKRAWESFHEWALSLKDYPPVKAKRTSSKRTEKSANAAKQRDTQRIHARAGTSTGCLDREQRTEGKWDHLNTR